MLSSILALTLCAAPALDLPTRVAASSGPARLLEPGALLAQSPEPARRKSTSLLLGAAEVGAGLVGGYAALLAGLTLNYPRGGVSLPPDTADLLLVGLLPSLGAAAAAWAVGLLDLSQRGLIGSLLLAVLGGAVGEAVGLAAGLLAGSSLYPSDQSAAVLVAIAAAPALAALGATLSMELFKPGEELRASASLTLVPAGDGALAAGPALLVAF